MGTAAPAPPFHDEAPDVYPVGWVPLQLPLHPDEAPDGYHAGLVPLRLPLHPALMRRQMGIPPEPDGYPCFSINFQKVLGSF